MATIEIRKKSASVWTHTPSDFSQFIQSKFRCKIIGEFFQVVEYGGRQLSEYHYSDVTVYDDVQGGSAETFSSGEELMLRLESLEYPAFFQGSGGGGIGFQPIVVNPENGQTLIYSNGQWVNGYLDTNGNRFINTLPVTIEDDEATVPEGFSWVINTNTYFNSADVHFAVESATAGFYRTDIIVAQASNTTPFIYIQGEESESTAIPPNVPDNTLLVTHIPVFGDQIGDPTPPIDGSLYISKDSEAWINFVLTGTGGLPTLVAINENQRNINITGNPSGTSSLGGYHNAGGSIPTSIFWSGMTVKVHNATASDQVIKHNYSSATIKFLFPKEADYIIKPNETAIFTYRGGALEFEVLSLRGLQEVTDIGNTTSNKIGIGTDESTGVDGNVSYLKIGDGVPSDEVNLFAISKTYEVGGTTSGRNGQNIEIRATGSANSPSRVARAIKSVAYINPNGFDFTNGGGSAMGVEGVARVTGNNGGSVDIITGGYFVNNIGAGNVKVKNSIAVYINGTQNGSSEKLDNVFGLFVLDQSFYHQATDNNVAGIFLNHGNSINSFSGKWAIYNNKIDPNYFRDRVLIGTNNLEGTDILKVVGNSSFDGDVSIYNIKADEGEEFVVTVDEDGKLKSEAKPTIPAQLNPTAGTGISISGTYPNLTFTNTAPNVDQSFDDVLKTGNETNLTALFIENDKSTTINAEEVTVTDSDTGMTTQLKSDGVKLKYDTASGISTIQGHSGVGDFNHSLQAKSGTIAHVGDFFPDIHFVDNSDDNTNLTTTSNVVILTSTNTSVTIINLPPLTDGLIIYVTNKGSADLKLASIGATYDFWENGVASPGIDVVAGTTLKLVCDGVHYIAF